MRRIWFQPEPIFNWDFCSGRSNVGQNVLSTPHGDAHYLVSLINLQQNGVLLFYTTAVVLLTVELCSLKSAQYAENFIFYFADSLLATR